MAFLVSTSVAMVVIAFLRDVTVGYDYYNYANYFIKVRNGGWSFMVGSANGYRFEFGYSLFNYLVSLFTGDIHIFMLAVAVFIVGLTAVLLYRYSPIPWIGMFIFISFGFYGISLCTIRETMATIIFMFAIHPLKNRKIVPYLLLVLLAASFHKALLIMIPVYFIAAIPLNWKSLTAYTIFTLLLSVTVWPIFNFITRYVFKSYATENGLYFMNGRDWKIAAVPVLMMIAAVLLKKLLLKHDPGNTILINLSIYSAILYILACQHFLFQRVGMMFFTSSILLIPEILAAIRTNMEVQELENSVSKKQKRAGAKTHQEELKARRKKEVTEKIRTQTYYYAAAFVIAVGFFDQVWTLLQNQLHLIPYVTFIGR